MPGRTPAEAFRAFMEPIEAAVACLGNAKVTTSPGGMTNTHVDHSWTLNGPGKAMVFKGGYCFRASMKYRFIEHEGGYRVTTLEYIYSLSCGEDELWDLHWHPVGSSPETRPHLHAAILGAGGKRAHRPTGRMTFEDAVEWVIASGVTPVREDWAEILSGSKAVHVQHRSWS